MTSADFKEAVEGGDMTNEKRLMFEPVSSEGSGAISWGFVAVGLVSLCFAVAQVLAEVARLEMLTQTCHAGNAKSVSTPMRQPITKLLTRSLRAPICRAASAATGSVLELFTSRRLFHAQRLMGCQMILALDPGTTETGWAILENGAVLASGIDSNDEVLRRLSYQFGLGGVGMAKPVLAIEMIASYGMAVGREVFETCVWIGRFQQAWHSPTSVRLVYRRDVKLHLCGSAKAKDQNIRQALLDKLGPQGTKKSPGPTYGVKSHAWAALAVAVTAHETIK